MGLCCCCSLRRAASNAAALTLCLSLPAALPPVARKNSSEWLAEGWWTEVGAPRACLTAGVSWLAADGGAAYIDDDVDGCECDVPC